MNDHICQDCDHNCHICSRPVEFAWTLRLTEVNETGRKLYEFFIEKDGDIIAEGSAHGILSIFDLARESVFENRLVDTVGSPASFTDIAFDSGRIHERERIIKLLMSLNVIRRDALGTLVAFDTHGERVVDLDGLEGENK